MCLKLPEALASVNCKSIEPNFVEYQVCAKEDVHEDVSYISKRLFQEYSDDHLKYDDIAMPEVEVTVYFGSNLEEAAGKVDTRIKIKRVMRSARNILSAKNKGQNVVFI